jgi:WD40 repeat protein
MCTVLLPPGFNPIAVNKYVISISYHIDIIWPVAFCSRCTVVLFSPKKNRQCHLLNSSRKTITCLAFSADGHYLVTGECGHLPSVRVWDLQEGGGIQIAEFAGHKYGISCVVSIH